MENKGLKILLLVHGLITFAASIVLILARGGKAASDIDLEFNIQV